MESMASALFAALLSERAPSLNARSSGSTSLTKILLFFWLSICPVTAKPGRETTDGAQQGELRQNER